MFHTRTREAVVAFNRPFVNKRQPVPNASWSSKGGEFQTPSHHGRQSASTATSVPVRFVTIPESGGRPMTVRFRSALPAQSLEGA